MPWVEIPFWTGSAEADSKDVSAQRLVNWFLAPAPPNSKSPAYLMPSPGLITRGTVGDGPVRGVCRFKSSIIGELVLVVSGTKLYSLYSDYSTIELGDIDGHGKVFMVANTSHVLIVTNQTKVYYSDGVSVDAHAETALRGAAYTDGYAAAIAAGSDQWYLYGPDAINTLQGFSSADRKPDHLIGLGAVGGQLWLLGEETTEIWQHTGASFPFERVQTFDFGCAAAASVVVEDNTIWWVGDDDKVYKALGLQPIPITPTWVARLIKEQAATSANAFVLVRNGRRFYVLNFSQKTLVYDDDTGLWHEMASTDYNRWRVAEYVKAFGRHLGFAHDTNTIWEMDDDTYDEGGATIRREADSAPIHAMGDRAWMHELHIDMEAGVGLETGQGSDPKLMLRWSDDGGRTWSNELTQSIGEIGDYGAQVRFNRLGYFRKRIIRIAVSDPVKAVVIRARARVEAVDS